MIKYLTIIFAGLLAFGAAAEVTDNLYHYKAEVISIYDGDTIRVDLDLGLGIHKQNEALRLYGINAPEVRGPEKIEGKQSRDYLRYMLKDHKVIVETVKDKTGKYGRLLATIWVKGQGRWCPKETWCDANKHLVKSGYAEFKSY